MSDMYKPLLSSFIAVAATAVVSASQTNRLPNIVIIFTDDQGYGDLGCFGAEGFATPNIDKMASEGVRFTDFYVAATVCSPSRAALMTGCYPKRVGLEKRVLLPNSKTGLNPSEITIAEMLKQKGYATGIFGKWHLGDKEKFMPLNQGFDRYFGLPYSNDMAVDVDFGNGKKIHRKNYPKLPLYDQDKVIALEPDQTQLTRRYTEQACRFIRENRGRPFFVYLPHSMPHVPLAASSSFLGKTKRGLYGDVITEVDWSVGKLLQTLKDTGQDRNTLVIYSSDNGPWKPYGDMAGSAGPLRNGKGTTWEGGQRVPTIMWWPGKLPAGKVCRTLTSTIDIMPTIAGLTGSVLPQDRIIDGKNIWNIMIHPESAKTPHKAFYYYAVNGKIEAIRSGKWKLHVAKCRGWNNNKNGPFKISLYDLSSDVAEKHNVADDNPEVVKTLTAMLRRFDAELTRTARPVGRLQH